MFFVKYALVEKSNPTVKKCKPKLLQEVENRK